MGQKPESHTELTDTLSITEFKTGGAAGFWLYDKTRGMNLSMRAKSERLAFVEALEYYQERLQEVERLHAELSRKVEHFVSQFETENE